MKRSAFKMWLIGEDTNVEVKDEWIKKKLQSIEPGKKILDAGAGELKWKSYCKHLEYTSQDFAQYDGKNNDVGLQSENWNYHDIDIVSDITEIPVPDQTFDAVLCTEVLEHVPNPNKALEELVRITKRGGVLILTAPFCSLTHMAPYHFCTGFNKYWYEENLKKCGCEIEECTRNGDFYSWLRQEIIRMPWVSKKYLNNNSILVKMRCALFAHFIKKYINMENESGELLCFQYLIVAKRIE